ncbi:MAG: TlpA disulfide reductase family protein [Casimicrobiaceae bacterium]
MTSPHLHLLLRPLWRALLSLCLALGCTGPALAVAVGEAPPGFALLDATGELVSLDRLRGKVVYVDFWASWCGPCRRSFPWMSEMSRRYHADGLTVIGVNVDKKRGDADRFLQQQPAAFTVVFDAAGATPSAWGVRGMPSSFLLDRQGKVLAMETGFDETAKDALESRIRQALEAR